MWSHQKNTYIDYDTTVYYDYTGNKNAVGWLELDECRACRNGSFIGNCTCGYINYLPDPRTMPESLLNDALRELIKVLNQRDVDFEISRKMAEIARERAEIDYIKHRMFSNLKGITAKLFDKARLNVLIEFKTIGELLAKGYYYDQGKRHTKDGKTIIYLFKDGYTLKVFVNRVVKRVSKSLVFNSLEFD